MNSSSLVPDNSSDSWLLCRSTPGAYAIARDSSVAGVRKPLGSRSRVAQGEDGNKRGSVGAGQKNPGMEPYRRDKRRRWYLALEGVGVWWELELELMRVHSVARGRATGRPSATTALCAPLLCLSSLNKLVQLCCERTSSGVHEKKA